MSTPTAEDGAVVDLDAAVQQHESRITIADREHQIPSYRSQDHLSGELAAFEGMILPNPTDGFTVSPNNLPSGQGKYPVAAEHLHEKRHGVRSTVRDAGLLPLPAAPELHHVGARPLHSEEKFSYFGNVIRRVWIISSNHFEPRGVVLLGRVEKAYAAA